jgi:hypothetical protein
MSDLMMLKAYMLNLQQAAGAVQEASDQTWGPEDAEGLARARLMLGSIRHMLDIAERELQVREAER